MNTYKNMKCKEKDKIIFNIKQLSDNWKKKEKEMNKY